MLFSSTGGMGHFTPLVPLIDAAIARGDEVLAVGPPSLEATLAARAHAYRVGAAPSKAELAEFRRLLANASPEEAEGVIDGEFFGRLCTAAMLPSLEEACDEWRPDLVLHETCEYSAAIAAERRGIPHTQVAISLARIEASAFDHAAPALAAHGSQVAARVRASGYLTQFPPSLDPSPYAATRRYRNTGGPESAAALPDWWDGSDAPLVYASFGSMVGARPIGLAAFRAALEAVGGMPVRVLLTVGRAAEIADLGEIPPNTHVEKWIPQPEVLAHASAVLCHGGSGTTFGALAVGLPLVFVPMFADQPANARVVESIGAGLVVEPSGAPEGRIRVPTPEDAPRIRGALESVLGDASYRQAAEGVAAEMSTLPSADDLLAALERELVAGP